MAFQHNLQTALSDKNWTPAHLAAALADRGVPVDVVTVDRWLRGANTPRADRIIDIALAIGVGPNELLGYEDAKIL